MTSPMRWAIGESVIFCEPISGGAVSFVLRFFEGCFGFNVFTLGFAALVISRQAIWANCGQVTAMSLHRKPTLGDGEAAGKLMRAYMLSAGMVYTDYAHEHSGSTRVSRLIFNDLRQVPN
jgi:hypothetical protein